MAADFGNVTIKDVARLSGVSSMTVSRVINGGERVSPATRQRVEEAIAELGYVPSRLARGLSRQKTGTLAVIVPDVANPFFTLIVRGGRGRRPPRRLPRDPLRHARRPRRSSAR